MSQRKRQRESCQNQLVNIKTLCTSDGTGFAVVAKRKTQEKPSQGS